MPKLPSTNDKYVAGWNSVVRDLTGKDWIIRDCRVEALAEMAHHGLLYHINREVCQGMLDCTREYSKNKQVPQYK